MASTNMNLIVTIDFDTSFFLKIEAWGKRNEISEFAMSELSDIFADYIKTATREVNNGK